MMPAPHTYVKMPTQKSLFRTIVSILTLQVTVLFSGMIPAPAASLPADELRSTITILAKARDRILGTSRQPSPPGMVNSTEQQDLLVFISYLDGRIFYYCEQLFDIVGPNALQTTACPVNQNGGPVSTRYMTIPDTSSRTAGEKLADLDSGFSESLGTFDEMLLKEQQNVSAQVKKQREEGSQAGTLPGEADGSNNNQASSAGGGDARDQSTAADPAGDSQAAGVGTKQQQQVPPTLGNKDLSRSDDDIVAKQLKEAAEQETDPEIKAKLWEEYRKYKAGTR